MKNQKNYSPEMIDIVSEIKSASKRISEYSEKIFILAQDAANSEAIYRKALAKEIMRLKDNKVPISIINEVAKGNLADLKGQRDLAELKYQAARDSIRAIQSQLSALQSILRVQVEI